MDVHIILVYAYKLLVVFLKRTCSAFIALVECVFVLSFKTKFFSSAGVCWKAILTYEIAAILVGTPRVCLKDYFTVRFVEDWLCFVIVCSEGHRKIQALIVVKNLIISIEVLLLGLNYIDVFLSEPNVSFLICIRSYDDKDDYSEEGSTQCLNEVFIFI